MNDRQLKATLVRAGFRGKALGTAFGIAKRESGGRSDAFNPDRSTGDQSYGLFQINMLGNLGPSRRQQFGLKRDEDLLDPIVNAKAAFRMSNGGRDFGAWGIGPNAYRTGAGYETIASHVAEMPLGPLTGSRAAKFLPSYDVRQDLPKPVEFKLPDFDVTSFLSEGGGKGKGNEWDDFGSIDGSLMSEFGLTPPPTFKQPKAPKARPGDQAPRYSLVSRPANAILPPRTFRSTHMTDNLGWPAIDIMGSPGTPVSAPVGGTVMYFHPTGAQGGGSMMIKGDDGSEYWVGHISNGLPAGTKLKPGTVFAQIADQSVSAPHVHWAKK